MTAAALRWLSTVTGPQEVRAVCVMDPQCSECELVGVAGWVGGGWIGGEPLLSCLCVMVVDDDDSPPG